MTETSPVQSLKIVIPALNEEETIVQTIASLSLQDLSSFADITLCVVDDGSKDDTATAAEAEFNATFHKHYPAAKFELVRHAKPQGISSGLNDGIHDFQNFDFILISQSDITIPDVTAVKQLKQAIITENLVGAYPFVIHVRELWETYPFWQKVLLDRQLNRRAESKVAKLVLLKSETIAKVGEFSEAITGTEDRDYYERVIKIGKLAAVDVEVIHLHNAATSFSWQKLLYKEGQQAEGSAAMLRKYGFSSTLFENLLILFRPLIAICNLIPIINFITIPITLVFFTSYAWNTIVFSLFRKFDMRLFALYPVLTLSLYSALGAFIISLYTGRVSFFRNK